MNYQRAFTYAAIGTAVLIPTFVIAQQQTQPPGANVFVANQVLRASDVEQMRLALVNAIARLNALESAGSSIRKSEIRQVPAVAASPLNDIGTATARCSETELLLDCSCRGISAIDLDPFSGNNNTTLNLRRVQVQNPTTIPACTCQSQNAGSNANSALVAIATCLPL
jgi:hypothetical protein